MKYFYNRNVVFEKIENREKTVIIRGYTIVCFFRK